MNPIGIFFIGLGLMAIYIWYLVTEKESSKRFVGTILTLLVVIFSVLTIYPPNKKIQRGIDINGGVSFTLRVLPVSEKFPVRPEDRDQAITVLQTRLNELGTKDITVVGQGTDRIIVQLPVAEADRKKSAESAKKRAEEIESIKASLKRVARLDFRLVNPQSDSILQQVEAGNEDALPPGWRILGQDPDAVEKDVLKTEDESGRKYVVRTFPDMGGEYVTGANAMLEPSGWVINVDFSSEGSKQFGRLTERNVGRPLAVVMDDQVLSAPNINEPIYGTCQISGDFTESEAKTIARGLRNPLRNPLVIDYENTVDATLGTDSVRQGVLAAVSGLVLTLIFMLIYYQFAGVVAIIGLLVNMLFLFGIMAIFQFNLTLPGIAGIILTIGVSLDSNILIFERLKEELRAGKSLKAALSTAYDKAFSAIFDANITTLITASILLIFSTGAIKGFAITLTVGIITTLFAALIVTRIVFGWGTHTGVLRSLRLWSPAHGSHFDFIGKRRPAAIISICLILIALGTFGIKNKHALGVDFRGGDLLTIGTTKMVDDQRILDSLESLNLPEPPFIQRQTPLGSDEENPITYITIRTVQYKANDASLSDVKIDEEDAIKNELLKEIPEFSDASINTYKVGPVMGHELLMGSSFALIIGLFGILIYVAMRFEFSFALAAIIALIHDLIITSGIIVLVGQELSMIHIGALLTIAGYSINDTIVIFDRLRENLLYKKGTLIDVMNEALNITLSRTILTGITTLLTLVTLYFFGGTGLRDFAFTIIFGVIIGTYSSLYIASPFVYWWTKKRKTNLRTEVLETETAAAKPVQ